MDINMYNGEPTEPHKPIGSQTTEPQIGMEATQDFPTTQSVSTTPFVKGETTIPLQPTALPFSPPTHVSRRKFMGVSVAGLAAISGAGAAAAIGGVALAKWLQNGGLGDFSHGPMASNTQIGH